MKPGVPMRWRGWIGALVFLGGTFSCSKGSTPPEQPKATPHAVTDDMVSGSSRPGPVAAADPAALTRFRADLARLGPTRELFTNHLPALGARPILDVLEVGNPACHGEAHELGRALMGLRKDIGAALRECGTGCTSACMHGAVGEAFGGSDIATITKQMNGFCATGVMHELHPEGNCAHGIGHALMFAADRDPDKALGGCSGFEKKGMRYYCATGVYMELLASPNPPTYPARSHEPCLIHPEFAAACYRYRARTLVSELGGLDALQKSCLAQKPPLRQGCFHGLGAVILGSITNDPSLLGRYCNVEGEADRTLCVEGVMEKQADFNRGVAGSICAKQTGDIRKACDVAVENGMYNMTKPSLALYTPPFR